MSNPILDHGVVPDILTALSEPNLGLEVFYEDAVVTAGANIAYATTIRSPPKLRISNTSSLPKDSSANTPSSCQIRICSRRMILHVKFGCAILIP